VWDEDGWPHRPTRPVVMEATRPHDDERGPAWNNLGLWRGVRAGGFAIHAAPRSGVQAAWVAPTAGADALRDVLARLLSAWDASAPPFRDDAMNESTREALRALGYLDE